jgi:hypothetical protein
MKKSFTKPVIIGALMLTLVGGGAYASTQGAFANTTTSTSTNKATQVKHGHGFFGPFSEAVLNLLKLDKAALMEKLSGGKSLAQVAQEQGISRDKLKETLTTQAVAEFENKKKEFVTNLDSMIDSTDVGKMNRGERMGKGGPGGKGGHGGPGGKGNHGGRGEHGMMKGPRINLTEVATLLGYSNEANLKTALHTGSSLAELAKSKNVELQKITDSITRLILTELDQRLADGKITQDQYNTQKASLAEKATQIANHKHQPKNM